MSDLLFFKDDNLIYKARQKPWKAPRAAKPQDAFEMSYSNVESIEMNDAELMAAKGSVMLFDTEVYQNFFYAAFRHQESGKIVSFEQSDDVTFNADKLLWLLKNFCIVGYNSKSYDIIILLYACMFRTCKQIYNLSCQIIFEDIRTYQLYKSHKIKELVLNHIDLIEVAPLIGSLKLYAGRLHTSRMQDLPIDPQQPLKPEDIPVIRQYCCNDLQSTDLLFRELTPALELRTQMSNQYGVDLRSKSDAQIAEAVLSSELNRLNNSTCRRPEINPGTAYRYQVPNFINYRTRALQQMLEIVRKAEFVVDGMGYIIMPDEIKELSLSVGKCIYKMGIGGLHSTEKSAAHKADDTKMLIDRDVVSFYPKMILNQRLYPKHLGPQYLVVYKTLVDSRIADKRAGNKIGANSKKIVVNGSFGKYGSKWSILYSPDLLIQVTISGQLYLLLLIEMIEDLGVSILSANTDGVVIECPNNRYNELQERIKWWESITNLETEESRYKAIYSRDVNNYVAHKDDGKCKVKGTYSERGSAGDSVLSKNPENLICNDAILALIEKGTPVEQTIRECKDIRRFVTIRNVTGGARKSQVYLGKVIRWYFSRDMKGEINRATTGDKIPNTHGARPLMELPAAFPGDIDYDRYIENTREALFDIGYLEGKYKALTGDLGALFETKQ